MKRGMLLGVLILFMILPLASASLQHGIIGYVQSAEDGTTSNGAIVTFTVSRNNVPYCTLTDIIGENGNSKQSNWYAQDLGNCEKDWIPGDVVYAEINRGSPITTVSYVLTSNGSDQMPSVKLNPPRISFWIMVLGMVIIVLFVEVLILLLIRRKKLKDENNLEKK
jgi:hypothetical protein